MKTKIMSDMYYIHRKYTFVGNAPSWWAKGGNGYTSYILGAEKFTKEEATKIVGNGDKYEMFKCLDVDKRLHLVFDIQDYKRLGTDAPCGWSSGYADNPSEIEQLRVDAERYRWLRENHATISEVFTEHRGYRLTTPNAPYEKWYEHSGWSSNKLSIHEEFDTMDEVVDRLMEISKK